MVAEPNDIDDSSLAVREDQPLIGIVLIENGQEIARFFVDETQVDAAVAAHRATNAQALAGAWDDLDWEDAVAELERIRHENAPTPPIDAL